MSTPDEERDALIEQIEAAFADVPYPGDDAIVVTQEVSESPEIRKEFTGKSWREISPGINENDRMEFAPSSLSWLTPEAFRYYLPAYFIATIKDFNKADVIPDSLIVQLCPSDLNDVTDALEVAQPRFEQIVATFSGEQKKTIKAFFRYLFSSYREFNAVAEGEPFYSAIEGIKQYWDAN